MLFDENYDPIDECQEGFSLLDEPLNWYRIVPVEGIEERAPKYPFIPAAVSGTPA